MNSFGPPVRNDDIKLKNNDIKIEILEEVSHLYCSFYLGIWGPYVDAIFPGFYLHEGGQSATGILLDHIVKSHPSYKDALENAGKLYVAYCISMMIFLSHYLNQILFHVFFCEF